MSGALLLTFHVKLSSALTARANCGKTPLPRDVAALVPTDMYHRFERVPQLITRLSVSHHLAMYMVSGLMTLKTRMLALGPVERVAAAQGWSERMMRSHHLGRNTRSAFRRSASLEYICVHVQSVGMLDVLNSVMYVACALYRVANFELLEGMSPHTALLYSGAYFVLFMIECRCKHTLIPSSVYGKLFWTWS